MHILYTFLYTINFGFGLTTLHRKRSVHSLMIMWAINLVFDSSSGSYKLSFGCELEYVLLTS